MLPGRHTPSSGNIPYNCSDQADDVDAHGAILWTFHAGSDVCRASEFQIPAVHGKELKAITECWQEIGCLEIRLVSMGCGFSDEFMPYATAPRRSEAFLGEKCKANTEKQLSEVWPLQRRHTQQITNEWWRHHHGR